MLERHMGWTGLLIEANPDDARNCQKNRPRSRCINAAVCDRHRIVHFVKVMAAGGILEFMSETHKKRWQGPAQSGRFSKRSICPASLWICG